MTVIFLYFFKAFAIPIIAYQVYFLASRSYKSCSMSGTVTVNDGVISFKALKSIVNHHFLTGLHTGQAGLL